MEINIWTDGACNKKGIGGWAYVLICQTADGKEIQRAFRNAASDMTNQRAELAAILAALMNFTQPAKFTIHSDSAYIVNCFLEGWHHKWHRNGWLNSKGEAVANQDLWKQILHHVDKHTVDFVKVKGHSGDEYNDFADEYATRAVQDYIAIQAGESNVREYGRKLGAVYDPNLFP